MITERSTVQAPLLRYAQEAGWTCLTRDQALEQRGEESSPVFHDVLVEQLQRLNPGVLSRQRAEDVARRLARVPATIEGNLDAWEFLRGLQTVFVETEKRERNVKLLDPFILDANTFHVTDEFTFFSGTHRIRADVVFLVNGIPVLFIEAKSSTVSDAIGEALEQVKRYHREGPELMALLQLYSLTNLAQFFYGATWTLSRKLLFNWREESTDQASFETLVKSFVDPKRLLRIISDFILFTRLDGQLQKFVLRPHQMQAVDRVHERARDPKKRRGLVWHTQGSGKTYTMITVAKKLIEDASLQNPTVLMLVDRNELEEQLFGNLGSVGMEVTVAESKVHLQQRLRQPGGVVVSTIQKFERMPPNINERENVFVLVDEAHRTTGGHLGNFLVAALPNATYVGFTGTPIDKTAQGRGTFKTFGADDPRGYLDKYSIRESIHDGTTVPLHYALAPNELQVDRETLEREFFQLAELEGVSDVETLNRVLEKAVNLRNELKNRDRVDKVARYAAKHFQEKVRPMGYKAFLVAVDREACTLYKDALDRYLPPEWSEVVISGAHNDPPQLARFHRREEEEEGIRQAFRKPDGDPQILIVTEKLLTGFDAPILYCMYLDKPVRDHVLLQAIARVNRPYEDDGARRKAAGFILDFVGIFDKLERALAFDSEDVSGVVVGISKLQEDFVRGIARGREEYFPLLSGRPADKAMEAVLDHFRDQERRQKFYLFFEELEQDYEILSPDAFLRPYLDDYDTLSGMYQSLKTNYDYLSVDKSFLRKTAELVQTRTAANQIRELQPAYVLDEHSLRELMEEDVPDTTKVFNLIKKIHDTVAEKGPEQPFLIAIGERAEQIAQAFKDGQTSVQQALDDLRGVTDEEEQAVSAFADSGLSRDAFTVSWVAKQAGVGDPRAVAEAAAEAFNEFPYWKSTQEQDREVRLKLLRALMDANLDMAEAVEITGDILDKLKAAGL